MPGRQSFGGEGEPTRQKMCECRRVEPEGDDWIGGADLAIRPRRSGRPPRDVLERKAMTAAFAPISALLLSVALLLMGTGLQGTLLPVRANIEAFSATDIGILGSAYYLGFAGGCLLGPRVLRRAAHIRAFAALVAVASCVVLVHSLFRSEEHTSELQSLMRTS